MAIKIQNSTIIDDSRNIVNAGIITSISVSIGNTQVISNNRELQNISSLNVSGTATASGFVGNLTGTATTATNLSDAANITTGTINSSRLSGTYNINVDYANTSGISTYSSTSGISTYSITSGLSTSVIGGISSVTQLQVTGVSTFTDGPVLIGTATSTGTASQRLQVTGGAYVSGNLSVGNTNPSAPFEVVKEWAVSVGTNNTFYSAAYGDSNRFTLVRVNGSINSPTAITSGQVLGNFNFRGYDGSSVSLGLANITASAEENFLPNSSKATRLNFGTTTIGSNQQSPKMTITSAGELIISNSIPSTTSLTGTPSQLLQVNGGAYFIGNIGIGSTNPSSQLSIVGDALISGVVTSTTFVGNLTGIASSVEVNSVGLGTHTYGNYVKDIIGTTNQITVTNGSGEGVSSILSIPSQFTAPQDVTVARDLQVNRNLTVNGNITIGGTSATLFTTEFKVYDPDIVVGFRTDGSGNDISTDNTANHGGLAVASTEGNPLVQLYNPGIGETNPATYKKIMWFKSGSFTGLGTDAWLINYAVGIGSTQFPSGTRLSVGSVQITENDISIVRNINASGIVTASSFSGNASSSTYSTSSGIATYATTSGISTSVIGGISSVTQLQVTGVSTFTNGPLLIGTATSTGTASQRLQVTGGAYVSGNLGIGTTNPTANVHIIGGTTAAGTAPLEISRGSLLSVIESDVFEYDGTNLYHTANDTINGFGRAVIPEVQFRRLTINNTVGTAASSIFGVGIGSFSVLANTLYELESDYYVTKTVAGAITFTFNLSTGSFVSLSGVANPLITGLTGATGASVAGGATRGQTANNSTIATASLANATSYAGRIKATFIPTANAKFTLQLTAGGASGTATILSDSYIKLVGYASTVSAGNVT